MNEKLKEQLKEKESSDPAGVSSCTSEPVYWRVRKREANDEDST